MGAPRLWKVRGRQEHYFTRTEEGEVVLLTMYAKGNTGSIPTAKLKEIRRALEK